jgi:hypothetical protein
MSQSTSAIEQRVSQLSAVLSNPATMLPVFVRFQKADQYLTIPVASVDLDGGILDVTTEDGSTHSINRDSLVDIVAFVDGAGKPVFLTDLSAGGEVDAGNKLEGANEESNDGLGRLIKHQHEYRKQGPICPTRKATKARMDESESVNALPLAA